MIVSADLDAVVISLPTHLHADAAIASFEAGNHVYVEKPLAASLAEGIKVVDAWKASGRVGMIGYNYRFNPLYAELRRMIADEKAGEPVAATSTFNVSATGLPMWKRTRETGGGAVLDLATHHFDLLRFLFDSEVRSVSASLTSSLTEHDSARIDLELENDVLAQVNVAFGGHFVDTIEIACRRGLLRVDRAASHRVEVSRFNLNPGSLAVIAQRFPTPGRIRYVASKLRSPFREPSYRQALRAFLSSARSRIAPKPDLADGYAALAIVDAVERSSLAGGESTAIVSRA